MPEPTPSTPTTAPTPVLAEPEIHVIPEKFYGAALKARSPEAKGQQPAGTAGLVQPPARGMMLPVILGIVVLLLILGGGFVYFNQELLFKKTPTPAPAPIVEAPKPAPVQPPTAPSNVAATSTNPQSASITWTDTASNESGFRVERAEETGSFQSLTSLSPNSTSFQDVSVSPGKTYRYRLIALNSSGESAASDEATAKVPNLPPPPPEAPKLPPAGLDTDSDGLTDLEEALLTTNARSPDTDSDGFLDGNEVFHLYNPGGLAPGKLLEAKLVKEVKGSIGWTMSIPNAWSLKLTNPDGSKATIETGKAESFTVSIEQNPNNQSIVDWYVATHPNVQASQLLQYRSKKGYTGIIGADLLTTYIPWGDRIFVFTYELKDQPFINYRTLYSMMLNSLMLTGLPQDVVPVAGATLPFEPGATSTGVISQPESIFPEASATPPSEPSANQPTSTPTEPVASTP